MTFLCDTEAQINVAPVPNSGVPRHYHTVPKVQPLQLALQLPQNWSPGGQHYLIDNWLNPLVTLNLSTGIYYIAVFLEVEYSTASN